MHKLDASQRRIVVLTILFAVLVVVSPIIVFFFHKRETITLKKLVEEAVRNGLQPTVTTEFNKDDSVRITLQSIERDIHEGNYPFARLNYVVDNSSNQKLLKVSGGCCVECTLDGDMWYPFSKCRLEDLENNALMLYNMSWIYYNASSNNTELYIDKGETTGIIGFSLDKAYPESSFSLYTMPNGLYRLVFRFCEYVDLEGIITRKAKLVDYGYYSVPFLVNDGKVCPYM